MTTPNLSSTYNQNIGLILPTTTGLVELNTKHLDKLFVNAALSLSPEMTPGKEVDNLALANELIAIFGLKESRDVINLLNSPLGKTIIGIVAKELAEIATREESLRNSLLEAQRQKDRRLAFLILGLLDEWEEEEALLYENTKLILEKQSANSQQTIKNTFASKAHLAPADMAQSAEGLKRNIAGYTEAATALEATLITKLGESEVLERALTNLETRMHLADTSHRIYSKALSQSDEEIQQIACLMESAEATATTIVTTVSNRIAELKNILLREATKIAADVAQYAGDGKKELVIRKMLMKNNAGNLQLARLIDMLSVVNGEKELYTIDGMPTRSFTDAYFVLSRDKKIVKVGDDYYLLPVETVSIHTLSEDEKEDARRAYLQFKPSILAVKQLVEHNHSLEHSHHKEEKSSLSADSERMQQELLLLARKLANAQSARANAQTLLAQLQATSRPMNVTAPRPSPRPAVGSKAIQETYGHIWSLLSHNPNKKAIARLQNSPNIAEPIKDKLANLKPGHPISRDTREDMDEAFHYQSPSPFNTSPSPFQGGRRPRIRG